MLAARPSKHDNQGYKNTWDRETCDIIIDPVTQDNEIKI